MIDPNTVERVEVTTRLNVLYGSQAVAGVIAVYLKQGSDVAYQRPERASTYSIQGFDKSRSFYSPIYGEQNEEDDGQVDYRSTLYWNPEIITDAASGAATFSLYAADLETTYRIVVEGVTGKNEPLHAEYFITIGND